MYLTHQTLKNFTAIAPSYKYYIIYNYCKICTWLCMHILHQCCFENWIMNTVANEIYYTVPWETIDNCKQLDIGLHTASNFYCNAHDIVSHCWNSKWQSVHVLKPHQYSSIASLSVDGCIYSQTSEQRTLFGNRSFVLSSEVVPISEVHRILIYYTF